MLSITMVMTMKMTIMTMTMTMALTPGKWQRKINDFDNGNARENDYYNNIGKDDERDIMEM